MSESLVKRLAEYEAVGLLVLYFCQHLMVVLSPGLIILGLGIANPIVLLGGLLSLRLLFLFSDLQREVMEQIARNEHQARFF